MTTTTTEPDALDERVGTPELVFALERFRERAHQRAVADVQAGRADLAAAVGAGDREKAATVAARLRELELIAEASPEPDFATSCASFVRSAFADVGSRFAREVMGFRLGTFERDRAAIAPRWGSFRARYQGWAKEGADAAEGVFLLREASFWHGWIDDYARRHPIAPPPDSMLAGRPVPKARQFIYLGSSR